MTTFDGARSRNRDMQDGIERHIFGEQEYIDKAGSVVRVTGTDTEDQEATVLNIGGVSFNLPKNSNAEVMLISGGSDTGQKYAILTIPFDKQRKWGEGNGGVQHPTDADFALEFNGKRAHITKGKFAVGEGGSLEIDGGAITIRGNLTVSGSISVVGGVSAGGTINTPGQVTAGSVHAGNVQAGSGGNNPSAPGPAPTPPAGFSP